MPFPEGTGPRRMTRDNSGNLWVALFGSGQVARIDMTRGAVVETFDLPDRTSAPYAVTWDERRKAVWVVNANSDAIYRLDPRTGAITLYPLPRPMAYLRQIAIDKGTGRLIGTYSNYPEGSGPSMGVLIDVGELIRPTTSSIATRKDAIDRNCSEIKARDIALLAESWCSPCAFYGRWRSRALSDGQAKEIPECPQLQRVSRD